MKKIFASLLIVLLITQNLSFAVGDVSAAYTNESEVKSGKEVNDLLESLDTNNIVGIIEVREFYNKLDRNEKKVVTTVNSKKLTDAERIHAAAIKFVKAVDAVKYDKTFEAKTKTAFSQYTALFKIAGNDALYNTQLEGFINNVKYYNEMATFITNAKKIKLAAKTINEAEGLIQQYASLSDDEKANIQLVVQNTVATKIAELEYTFANVKGFDNQTLVAVEILENNDETFSAKLNVVSSIKEKYTKLTKLEQSIIDKNNYSVITNFEKNNKEVVNVKGLIDKIDLDGKNFTKTVTAAKKAYDTLEKKLKTDVEKHELQDKLGESYVLLNSYVAVADIVTKSTTLKLKTPKDLETFKAVKNVINKFMAENKNIDDNLSAKILAANEALEPHTALVTKVEEYTTDINEAFSKEFDNRETALKAIEEQYSEDMKVISPLVDPALKTAIKNVAKTITDTKALKEQIENVKYESKTLTKDIQAVETKYAALTKGKTEEQILQLNDDLGDSYTKFNTLKGIKELLVKTVSVKLAKSTDVFEVQEAYELLTNASEELSDITSTIEFHRINELYEITISLVELDEKITDILEELNGVVTADTLTTLAAVNDEIVKLGKSKSLVDAKKVSSITSELKNYTNILAARKSIAEFDMDSANYVVNATKLITQVSTLKITDLDLLGKELKEKYTAIQENLAGPLKVDELFEDYVTVDGLRNITVVNTIEKEVLEEALKNDDYKVEVKTKGEKLVASDTVIVKQGETIFNYKIKLVAKKKYSTKSYKVDLTKLNFENVESISMHFNDTSSIISSSYDYTFTYYDLMDPMELTTVDYLKYATLDYTTIVTADYLLVQKSYIQYVPNAKNNLQFTLKSLAATKNNRVSMDIYGEDKDGNAIAHRYKISSDNNGNISFDFEKQLELIKTNGTKLSVDLNKGWIDDKGIPYDLMIGEISKLYDLPEGVKIVDVTFESDIYDYMYYGYYAHWSDSIFLIPNLSYGNWEGVSSLSLAINVMFSDGSMGEKAEVTVNVTDDPIEFQSSLKEIDLSDYDINDLIVTKYTSGDTETIDLSKNSSLSFKNNLAEDYIIFEFTERKLSITTLAQEKNIYYEIIEKNSGIENDLVLIAFTTFRDGTIQVHKEYLVLEK